MAHSSEQVEQPGASQPAGTLAPRMLRAHELVAARRVAVSTALLSLLPWLVAYGSLVTVRVPGANAGPTDLLVAGLAVWLLADVADLMWSQPGGVDRHPARWCGHALSWLGARWRDTPWAVLCIAGLCAYAVVIMVSAIPATNYAATAKELLKWAETAVVVWFAVSRLHDDEQLRAVVWSAIGAGVSEALLGNAQWAIGDGAAGPGGATIRVFGTFLQPNPFAADLNLALPLALAVALWAADARARWVAAAAAVLLVNGEVLAASRGALIALVGAVVIMLVVGLGRERLAGLAALFIVPLGGMAWLLDIVPASWENRIQTQFRVDGAALGAPVTNANFSTVERLAHWVAGLRMFASHPLLGVGAGNYDAAYGRYAVPGWPDALGHAHNYYINAAAETGALGLGAFVLMLAGALALAWIAARRSVPWSTRSRPWTAQWGRAVALGVLGALVTVALHNLFDDLFVHAMELQFGLYVGIALSLAARAPNVQRMTDVKAAGVLS